MSLVSERRMVDRLGPEKIAYWYFRLNGFFQIENFIVHPEGRGGQRTDADLLAVRFPFRAERLFDRPNDIMADHVQQLALSCDLVDVVIAEVKTNQPCTFNRPWTRQHRKNVHRMLAAIGCLPNDRIERRRQTSTARDVIAATHFASVFWRSAVTEARTSRRGIPR